MYRIYTTTNTINLDSRQSAINFICTNLLTLDLRGLYVQKQQDHQFIEFIDFHKNALAFDTALTQAQLQAERARRNNLPQHFIAQTERAIARAQAQLDNFLAQCFNIIM